MKRNGNKIKQRGGGEQVVALNMALLSGLPAPSPKFLHIAFHRAGRENGEHYGKPSGPKDP